MKPVRTFVQTCEYNYNMHLSSFTSVVSIVRPFQGVLGNREKRAFISGEQRPNFEWNRGTKTLLGNRKHKKVNYRFFVFFLVGGGGGREQGNKRIYFRGTREHLTPVRVSILRELLILLFRYYYNKQVY